MLILFQLGQRNLSNQPLSEERDCIVQIKNTSNQGVNAKWFYQL